MNNKFMLIIAVIVTQVCYSSQSKVDAALTRVKARYHIQNKDDYVVYAVSKTTAFDDKKECCCGFGSYDYDLLGLILNKKPVVWIECPEYYLGSGLNNDLELLLKHKDIRCACIKKRKQGSMYLMYTVDGCHKALALIKAALDLIDKGHRISVHTDDTRFEYLTGVCLGYDVDDIDFYFQRIAFHNIKGFWPESQKQFEQFLEDEWVDSREQIDLQQAKLEISDWLDEHSDVTLQQYIDSYKKNHKDIQIIYDLPFVSFMHTYKKSWKERLIYGLADCLTFVFGPSL